jgi:UDP-2,3-diacylglucosamine pyrophosphatase LpxH
MHIVPTTFEREVHVEFSRVPRKLSTVEDFLSCAQYENETLPNFYRRFLQLKAQASKVFDDQVIAQAIKALCVGHLHSHLVRERPKTVVELYEEFAKFSKSEVLHFRKLEQQTKAPRHDETPRLAHYYPNQCSYPKQVHNIDSDDCGPSEN